MTETNSNGESGSTLPPKRKFVIGPLTPSINLQTEKLGVLKVSPLSMKALIKISPDLDPKKESSDMDLVKSLLLAVTTHTPVSEEQQARTLTIEEANQITQQDIRDFAIAFLEREKWEPGAGENGSLQDPEAALASKIRLQIAQIGETTQKQVDQFREILSGETKRLFMMNTALSERLKEISGISPINQILKNTDRFSSVLKDYDHLSMSSMLKGTLNPDELALAKDKLSSAKTSPVEQIIPLPHNFRSDDTPINRAAKAMTDLNKKTDSFKETVDTMAAAIGVINEAVASALLDFKAQQQRDDRSQRISLYIAAGSLAASLVVGLVSLYFSWASYELAKSSDNTSAVQKQSVEQNAIKQIDVLKEISVAQQLQNKMLGEIQSAMASMKIEIATNKRDDAEVHRPLPSNSIDYSKSSNKAKNGAQIKQLQRN